MKKFRNIRIREKLVKMSKNKNNLPDGVLQAGKKVGKNAGKILNEFKEFISQGNVTDMAFGIIVGTSLTTIVNSLSVDVITPLMGLFLTGIDFTSFSFTVESFIFRGLSVTVWYGRFIQAVISFLITALIMFFLIKTLNAFRRKPAASEESEKPKLEPDIALLTEIRDLLRKANGLEPIAPEDTGNQLTLYDEDNEDDKENSANSAKEAIINEILGDND